MDAFRLHGVVYVQGNPTNATSLLRGWPLICGGLTGHVVNEQTKRLVIRKEPDHQIRVGGLKDQ